MKLLRDKMKEDAYMNVIIQNMFARGEIRNDHPLQREADQWDNETRDGYISTVVKNEDVFPIVLCEQLTDFGVVLWLIDGWQRISTLIKYKNGMFKIGKKVEMPIVYYQVTEKDDNGKFLRDENGNLIYKNIEYDLRGKGYDDLPVELKERFDNYKINVTKHLDCTDDEIGYHIRRYNRGQKMNMSQKSVTYMDSVAKYVKNISLEHRFFKDCGEYSYKQRNNGAVDRIVIESVMCMFHFEDWNSRSRANGIYLNKNSSKDEFNILKNNLDMLTGIVNEKHKKLFNIKNSFFWFTIFNEFLKLNVDANRFKDFLDAYVDRLQFEKIDGYTFDEIESQKASTKQKTIVIKKMEHLKRLMNDFFKEECCSHNNIKEVFIINSDEMNQYIDEFKESGLFSVIKADKDTIVDVAVRSLFGFNSSGMSHEEIQKKIDECKLTKDDYDDHLLYLEELNDWTYDINCNASILNPNNIPILIQTVKVAIDEDKEDEIKEWFVNYSSDNSKNNITYKDIYNSFILREKNCA